MSLRLRVKDIDFAQAQIVVRDGKGGNSRITMLPVSIVVLNKGVLSPLDACA
jgi:hypothetical protein